MQLLINLALLLLVATLTSNTWLPSIENVRLDYASYGWCLQMTGIQDIHLVRIKQCPKLY